MYYTYVNCPNLTPTGPILVLFQEVPNTASWGGSTPNPPLIFTMSPSISKKITLDCHSHPLAWQRVVNPFTTCHVDSLTVQTNWNRFQAYVFFPEKCENVRKSKPSKTDIQLTAVSEPHGTNRNAPATSPEYIRATYKVAQLLHLYCHSEIQDGCCKWQIFLKT